MRGKQPVEDCQGHLNDHVANPGYRGNVYLRYSTLGDRIINTLLIRRMPDQTLRAYALGAVTDERRRLYKGLQYESRSPSNWSA